MRARLIIGAVGVCVGAVVATVALTGIGDPGETTEVSHRLITGRGRR